MQLIFPKNGATVDTHYPYQNIFLEKIRLEGIEKAVEWLEPIKSGREISYPAPTFLEWESDDGEFTVELSRSSDFSDGAVIRTRAKRIPVFNLEIGAQYFWRVNGSEAHTFYTENNKFRFLFVEGVPNFRDLGGIKIKQGLLFRGGELERCYTVTERGKDTFCNQLGIRTELDLRADMIGRVAESAAGKSVDLVQLPYRPYSEIFEEQHRQGIVKIMELLADESRYPVYFHCLGGADRTGMIALYLRALAGESDSDIHTDYELTSLSAYAMGLAEGARATGFRMRTSSYYSECIGEIGKYASGAPLSVSVRAFLLDCGVSEQTLDKIVRIIKK